jgi:hypothetical protein
VSIPPKENIIKEGEEGKEREDGEREREKIKVQERFFIIFNF